MTIQNAVLKIKSLLITNNFFQLLSCPLKPFDNYKEIKNKKW